MYRDGNWIYALVEVYSSVNKDIKYCIWAVWIMGIWYLVRAYWKVIWEMFLIPWITWFVYQLGHFGVHTTLLHSRSCMYLALDSGRFMWTNRYSFSNCSMAEWFSKKLNQCFYKQLCLIVWFEQSCWLKNKFLCQVATLMYN